MRYFNENSIVFLDGRWVKATDANVTLFTQTMHYGYGAFDGMRSYRNADGCNIFKAREHFDRLRESSRKLGIQVRYGSRELVDVAYNLLKRNNLKTAYIRPLVFVDPNMDLTAETDGHVFIAAWPWQKYLGDDPIDVMVSQYKRPSTNPLPMAKIVGGYTASIMASTQAKQLGYHEALIVTDEGWIAEGPASNFFLEKDEVLYTPRTDHALAGITRATIMDLAKNWGIEVVEKDISIGEAYEADYAFFTGTATEITPIGSINGEKYTAEWENTQGHALSQAYRQLVMNDEFQGLTIV